jgi:hypothetical protein
VTIIIAWILGSLRAQANLMPAIKSAIPDAGYLESIDEELYAAYTDAGKQTLLGYVALGESSGYGGPLVMAVAVDPDGEVIGISIAAHKETPARIEIVQDNGLIGDLVGRSYFDGFIVGQDVDSISGATYTTRAIAESVLRASHRAAEYAGLPVPEPVQPKIVFGVPEIVLLALIAVGYIGHRRGFKYTKQIYWASILVGMIVLGFMYNRPLTISYINTFLLGFWPQWRTHLYWYLLIGGMLIVFTVDYKNPYCKRFCPFGAAQVCMGVIGGAKVRSAGRYDTLLLWLQRGLAWMAIVLAMYFQNPGVTSYEMYGALFDLTGTIWQFALLGIVLITALFINRPWCKYLCPIPPVLDLYGNFREWGIESWRRLKKRTAG